MPVRPAIEPLIAPIKTADEALAIVAHLYEIMDALLEVIDQETALVRNGRLAEAAGLEPAKARLAQLYIADVARLKASSSYLDSKQQKIVADLRQRHIAFHANLQVNLTVLATVHAVAEGIVRGVSQEVTQKARPQVYGASGRSAGVPVRQSQPIAVSRVL